MFLRALKSELQEILGRKLTDEEVDILKYVNIETAKMIIEKIKAVQDDMINEVKRENKRVE